MLATWAAVYEMIYKLIKSSCGSVGQMLAHMFRKVIFQQAWRIGLWRTEPEHDLMCGKELKLKVKDQACGGGGNGKLTRDSKFFVPFVEAF